MHAQDRSHWAVRSLPGAAVVLAAAVGLAVWLFHLQAQWSGRYWQQQLSSAADDELPLLARRLAARGEAGIAAMVAGLGSPRESVRREMRLALDEELNRWQSLPKREASLRLGWLSAALAAEAERIDGASRPFAADLATRLLLWPTEGSVVDRSRLVAECERVLRASNGPSGSPGADRWRRQDDLAEAAESAARRRNSPLPVIATRESLSPATLAAPALPPLSIAGPSAETNVNGTTESPRRLRPDSSARAVALAPVTKRSAVRNPLRAAANEPARADDAAAEQAGFSQSLDEAQQAGSLEWTSAADETSGLAKREALELFAELGSENAADVEAELSRRGFTKRQIEVGKHLTAADPEVRRRWTEALPGMRGIDTKQWLLHLSGDQDAQVRQAAVTLLATSQDPRLLARVEEVARNDPDPGVRQQAARAAAAGKSQPGP